MWHEVIFPFPNFNGSAWAGISNFIPHITNHVITCMYPVCVPNNDKPSLPPSPVKAAVCLFCLLVTSQCKNGQTSALDWHHSDVIMSSMASQVISLTFVYSTIYSSADQRKRQSFASLAFMRGIHRWPVNSPHKGPITRKVFPFDDVIMGYKQGQQS